MCGGATTLTKHTRGKDECSESIPCPLPVARHESLDGEENEDE